MADLKMDKRNIQRRKRRKQNVESARLERLRAKRYYDNTPELQKERGIRKGCMKGCPEKEILKAILAWKTFNGICQACGTPCSIKFDTDHDHAQMIFRGIIGSKCNKTLGLVDDSIPRLKALMDYLGRFQ